MNERRARGKYGLGLSEPRGHGAEVTGGQGLNGGHGPLQVARLQSGLSLLYGPGCGRAKQHMRAVADGDQALQSQFNVGPGTDIAVVGNACGQRGVGRIGEGFLELCLCRQRGGGVTRKVVWGVGNYAEGLAAVQCQPGCLQRVQKGQALHQLAEIGGVGLKRG